MTTNQDDHIDTVHSKPPATITIVSNGILFSAGSVFSTPYAIALMRLHGFNMEVLLNRFLHGDFGDIHPDDLTLNKNAIIDGSRIMGVYRLASPAQISEKPLSKRLDLPTIWIIADAVECDPRQRKVTTFLTPACY
jgi:hypothetical protein